MNQVLLDIVNTGYVTKGDGNRIMLDSHIDDLCGSLLQRTIRKLRPAIALEVGLAHGISTLYILEAMSENGGQKLVGMDPAQFDEHWQGSGISNIRKAGYDALYEFHECTSQQLLPQLVQKGLRIDFAFIDGWHTFDHALVDFFYIDQMLNDSGIVVFDDVGYPSIRRVCEFILTNRDYEIHDAVRYDEDVSAIMQVKRNIKNIILPLCKTDKTPNRKSRKKLSMLTNVYFLALKKINKDQRRWDHFIHF